MSDDAASSMDDAVIRLQEVASELGISCATEVQFGGKVYRSPGVLLFLNLGAAKGMVWMHTSVRTNELVELCAAEGYGYSSWSETGMVDAVGLASVFIDWGWSGPEQDKPLWMRIAERCVDETREAMRRHLTTSLKASSPVRGAKG